MFKHDEHEVAEMTDRLRSIQEAADRLGISPWTVRRLADRGELRSVRMGRRVLISEREIVRVINNGTVKARGDQSRGDNR